MVNPSHGGKRLDLGHECSRIAFSWAKRTFSNCSEGWGEPVLKEHSTFCNILRLGPLLIGISSDGIGTKIEVAERMNVFDTLGFDLVAMIADDLVCNGIIPTSISNIIDADRLDLRIVDELMRGLHEAAGFARICVTGGEIAELGTRNNGFGPGMHFDWCGTGIGYLPSGREPITGAAIRPGDALIALESPGFRSNGFSRIRSIMEGSLGGEWHNRPFGGNQEFGELVLTPSRVYSPVIVDLLATGVPVNGIAHITGGGIPDNLGRILKGKGLGAHLDGLFEPKDFVREIQELGGVPDDEAYRMWNMGNGMILVLPPEHVDRTLSFIERRGCPARAAGSIRPRGPIEIRLPWRKGKTLSYEKTGK